MTKPLTIEVVSDVVCPWCFIGARRLEDTLASMPEAAGAEVVFHPFLLDPSTPPEGQDLRERLQKKYGMNPETMFGRVEAAAKDAGIALDFSKVRRSVATTRAHTLLRHALDKGTQRALARALFEAYFLEGKDIGQIEVLDAIAEKHGFTAEEADALLRDPTELARTQQEARDAAKQGIQGVPFFLFGGKLAVSGAQPPEVLKGAISRALAG